MWHASWCVQAYWDSIFFKWNLVLLPNQSKAFKEFGVFCSEVRNFLTLCTSGAGVSSKSACIAGFDRRLVAWLDMTYMFSLCVLPVAWRVAFVI